MTLRSSLIRLAHSKPELRSELLPLLKQAVSPFLDTGEKALKEFFEENRGKVLTKEEIEASGVNRGIVERKGKGYWLP